MVKELVTLTYLFNGAVKDTVFLCVSAGKRETLLRKGAAGLYLSDKVSGNVCAVDLRASHFLQGFLSLTNCFLVMVTVHMIIADAEGCSTAINHGKNLKGVVECLLTETSTEYKDSMSH